MSSVGTAVNAAGVQLPSRGWARTLLKGPGDGGERFYLSPRMAYWLSSCKCCIDAVPPVSSLPRFLCFTTSKVFSISLSLKRDALQSDGNILDQLLSLNATYLRVSTCLEVAIREGNCVSLKISGGPWVAPLLVVVSRAPGGRYTPAGFDSGSSTSSVIKNDVSLKEENRFSKTNIATASGCIHKCVMIKQIKKTCIAWNTGKISSVIGSHH